MLAERKREFELYYEDNVVNKVEIKQNLTINTELRSKCLIMVGLILFFGG